MMFKNQRRCSTLPALSAAKAGRQFRRFCNDERGVSAIEFAVVAPFLVVAWLGVSATLDMQARSTQIGQVTATVADIIARSENVTAGEIDAAFNVANIMLEGTKRLAVQIGVAGVEMVPQADGGGPYTPNIVWSCQKAFGTGTQMTPDYSIPNELRGFPGFYVVAYSEYEHQPILVDETKTYSYQNLFVSRDSLETLSSGCP